MKRRRNSSGNRAQRVAEQFHHEIAELIRGELKDPRVAMATVTGVDLTPDYAYLTVHVSVLPDDPETVEQTMQGLVSATRFLRGQLGRRVKVHTTPELRFTHDKTSANAAQMSALIDSAIAVSAHESESPSDPLQERADDDSDED